MSTACTVRSFWAYSCQEYSISCRCRWGCGAKGACDACCRNASITLEGVDPWATWFVDRPVRRGGRMMAERFFGQDFWENGALMATSSSNRHQLQLQSLSTSFHCDSDFSPPRSRLLIILACSIITCYQCMQILGLASRTLQCTPGET